MNAYVEEYLGRKITVKNSSDIQKIGLSGYVLDESKNVFTIKTKNDVKKIPKKGSEFEIIIDNLKYLIKGDLIEIRPEDRVRLMKKLGC